MQSGPTDCCMSENWTKKGYEVFVKHVFKPQVKSEWIMGGDSGDNKGIAAECGFTRGS